MCQTCANHVPFMCRHVPDVCFMCLSCWRCHRIVFLKGVGSEQTARRHIYPIVSHLEGREICESNLGEQSVRAICESSLGEQSGRAICGSNLGEQSGRAICEYNLGEQSVRAIRANNLGEQTAVATKTVVKAARSQLVAWYL